MLSIEYRKRRAFNSLVRHSFRQGRSYRRSPGRRLYPTWERQISTQRRYEAFVRSVRVSNRRLFTKYGISVGRAPNAFFSIMTEAERGQK